VTIEILPRAREDIIEGWHFYEQQEHGAGSYFRDSILAAIDGLAITVGVHAKLHGFHRAIADPFPFAIYYRVSGVVHVHAILDCRRDPAATKRTLRSR
jgi:plasmid stabilization system protein ParE